LGLRQKDFWGPLEQPIQYRIWRPRQQRLKKRASLEKCPIKSEALLVTFPTLSLDVLNGCVKRKNPKENVVNY
jgi:hypothetical protein